MVPQKQKEHPKVPFLSFQAKPKNQAALSLPAGLHTFCGTGP